MTVHAGTPEPPGKAGPATTGFVAPCLAEIDEDRISDLLGRDHFSWLDLTTPDEDDASLHAESDSHTATSSA